MGHKTLSVTSGFDKISLATHRGLRNWYAYAEIRFLTGLIQRWDATSVKKGGPNEAF